MVRFVLRVLAALGILGACGFAQGQEVPTKVTLYFDYDCRSPAQAPEQDVTASNSRVDPPQAWKSFRLRYGAFALHKENDFARPRWPNCTGWYARGDSACVNIPEDIRPIKGIAMMGPSELSRICAVALAKCYGLNVEACADAISCGAQRGLELISDIGRTTTCP